MAYIVFRSPQVKVFFFVRDVIAESKCSEEDYLVREVLLKMQRMTAYQEGKVAKLPNGQCRLRCIVLDRLTQDDKESILDLCPPQQPVTFPILYVFIVSICRLAVKVHLPF